MRVGANYIEFKKDIIYEEKYIVEEKYIFIERCAHQSRQAHLRAQGLRYHAGPQGQRKFKSPGNLEHFDPIVGTGSAPIDFVDSTLRGGELKGAQPVGECTNRGHISGPN